MPTVNPISPVFPAIPDVCPRCKGSMRDGREMTDVPTMEDNPDWDQILKDGWEIVHTECLTPEEKAFVERLEKEFEAKHGST